jgi:hypothetical protein
VTELDGSFRFAGHVTGGHAIECCGERRLLELEPGSSKLEPLVVAR